MRKNRIVSCLNLTISVLVLSACGGGGSSLTPAPSPTPTPTPSGWVAGQFPDENNFKNKCATPRTGTDSFNNNQPFPDQQGTAMDEKMWLRSWSNNTYLWYDEITDVDPTPLSISDYFSQLKTNANTVSGTPKDNFHFSTNTAEYKEQTQSGTFSGYGISWEVVRNSPPRKLIARYSQPNSPAALAGLRRGAEIVSVNGIDFVNGDRDSINAGLFPKTNGEQHTFVVRNADGNEQTIVLTSAEVAISPVLHSDVLDTSSGRAGYLLFNTFSSNRNLAQQQLVSAFQRFSDNNVNELVVDLRYNGGGLLAVASQLAYMVAGSVQTSNKVFESIKFNNKHPNTDPVTRRQLSPTPFYDKRIQWKNNGGGDFTVTLPSVDLRRVFVLATDNTCSASEAFINGLRGIDVEVILIGSTTCGKPYGFYPTDNCGTTYFTIQFKGINNKGFGDYADGFIPNLNPNSQVASEVKGCKVADDFANSLGNPSEGMLAAAIGYMQTGSCPLGAKAKPEPDYPQDPAQAIDSGKTLFESSLLHNKLIVPLQSQE